MSSPLSPQPRSAPTSPVNRGSPFAFSIPHDGRRLHHHRRTRTVQVSGMFGELSWSAEQADSRSRPPRPPPAGAHRPATVALAPISEEHKEQQGGTSRRAPSLPQLPNTPYTPSNLGPRRLPPVEAIASRPSPDRQLELGGLGRRRERERPPQAYALPPPITTPHYPPYGERQGRYSETPSPRTPSPPVTPETPDIETRMVRDNIDHLQRQFAKQLYM